MQIQVTKQEKIANNMSVYNRIICRNQTTKNDRQRQIFKVYSPEKFKLRPRDDIYLGLKFDIQTPETIERWLNLLPLLKSLGLHTENKD